MRDSKSLDFDQHGTVSAVTHPVRNRLRLKLRCAQTIIQAQAGSPSAADPGTPGMLTPKELTVEGAEPNPFHEFTSVTREFDE